jgi:hypothetical protein
MAKPQFTVHPGSFLRRPIVNLSEPDTCDECGRELTWEGHHVVVCVPDWRGKRWGGR